MSLIDRLATPPSTARSSEPGAAVNEWIRGLNQAEQDAVLAAAVDPAWGHRQLLDLLIAEGMPQLSDTTFRTWRVSKGWKK